MELGVISKSINKDKINYNVKEKYIQNELYNTKDIKENADEEIGLGEDYIEIFNLIPYFPVGVEYLAEKTSLKISQINQKLTMLELEGYIKSMPGNNYVRI